MYCYTIIGNNINFIFGFVKILIKIFVVIKIFKKCIMPDKWYTKVRVEPADGIVVPPANDDTLTTGTFIDENGVTLRNAANQDNVVLT